jgi:calcineurin-like phosphoesterase family protein
MTWFFTSDQHFGHQNIIEYCARPFDNLSHMHDELIRRWNDVVTPHDRVVVLGDFALGKIADTLPLVAQLNGYKILVPGNHDRCWVGHKKYGGWTLKYLTAGFHEVRHESRIFMMVEDLCVQLSHFPFYGDSEDTDRYDEYRPHDGGQFLLHGHVHGSWKMKANMINVGVDVWDYTPVSSEALKELIVSAKTHKGPQTNKVQITRGGSLRKP